jgi:transcriptional regulator with XRE-family HTH domain
MMQKELAEALGVSPAMVSKLAKRGMPTDSLERAQRWRKRHLEPGRIKRNRAAPAPLVGLQSSEAAPVHGGRAAGDDSQDDAPDLPENGDLLFQKTRELRLRSEKLELDLATQKKTLTVADDVRQSTFTAFRSLRDRLQAFGRQVAPKVAAVPDVHTAQTIIEGEMRELLDVFINRELPALLGGHGAANESATTSVG